MLVVVSGAAVVVGATVVGVLVAGVLVVGAELVVDSADSADSAAVVSLDEDDEDSVVVGSSAAASAASVVEGPASGTISSGAVWAPSGSVSTVVVVVVSDVVAWDPSSVPTADTWSSSSPGRNHSMPPNSAATTVTRKARDPRCSPLGPEAETSVSRSTSRADSVFVRLGSRIRESRRHS